MAAVKVEEMEEAARAEDSAVDLAVAKVEEMEAAAMVEDSAVDLAAVKVEAMEEVVMEGDSAVDSEAVKVVVKVEAMEAVDLGAEKVAVREEAVREEVLVVGKVAVVPCRNLQDHYFCCHTQIWLGTTSHHRIYQSVASLELRSVIKHPIHCRHLRCVPTPNVLIELRSVMKCSKHTCHF